MQQLNQRGATLIDSLIALALLGTAIAGLVVFGQTNMLKLLPGT